MGAARSSASTTSDTRSDGVRFNLKRPSNRRTRRNESARYAGWHPTLGDQVVAGGPIGEQQVEPGCATDRRDALVVLELDMLGVDACEAGHQLAW